MLRRTDALQGSLDLLVLKIQSRRPRLHGYAIMSAIQDISADVLRVEEVPFIQFSTAWKRPAGFAPSGSPRRTAGAPASTK